MLIRDHATLDLTKSFSFSCDFKTAGDGAIMAKGPPGTHALWAPYCKALVVHKGRLKFDIAQVASVSGTTSVADNRWHRVAVAFDDGSLTVQVGPRLPWSWGGSPERRGRGGALQPALRGG